MQRGRGNNQAENMSTATPERVFAALWNALVDLLGPAATAALLRRSIKQAAGTHPEFPTLRIDRHHFEYQYELPAEWRESSERATAALKALTAALCPLLWELTGPVVLRRLREVPLLAGSDLLPLEAHRES